MPVGPFTYWSPHGPLAGKLGRAQGERPEVNTPAHDPVTGPLAAYMGMLALGLAQCSVSQTHGCLPERLLRQAHCSRWPSPPTGPKCGQGVFQSRHWQPQGRRNSFGARKIFRNLPLNPNPGRAAGAFAIWQLPPSACNVWSEFCTTDRCTADCAGARRRQALIHQTWQSVRPPNVI